jgi:hypothetical protein
LIDVPTPCNWHYYSGGLIINGDSRFQVRLPIALGVEIRGAAQAAGTGRELIR